LDEKNHVETVEREAQESHALMLQQLEEQRESRRAAEGAAEEATR
jgi:hypothetical protein